jgi:hypothetical protein
MQGKLLGIISVDFDATGQLLIIYSAFIKYLRKSGNTMKQCIDLKKAYDSIRREVMYNILTEFGFPMKLARLIKNCPNETCSRVQVGKHLSDMFLIKKCLKHTVALSPLHFNFALEYAIGG